MSAFFSRMGDMEFYFSGTVERIIFENPNNFFRILLLDIEDTDAEFDDFGDHRPEPWPISWKDKTIPLKGNSCPASLIRGTAKSNSP